MSNHSEWENKNPFLIFKEIKFSIFAAAHLLAIASLWGSRIAIDWMVLQLTGSATQVGIVAMMQFLPMLFCGFIGGAIVDLFSKKLILILTNLVSGVSLLAVGIAFSTGVGTLQLLYVISLIIGLLTIVDNPSRLVIVGDLVPLNKLAIAIQVNSSIFHLGALLGPAVIGYVMYVSNAGSAMLLTGSFSLCTVILVSIITIAPTEQSQNRSKFRSNHIFGGFIYLSRERHDLIVLMVLVLLMTIVSRNTPVIFTDYANRIFSSGVSGYALMNILIAIGAVIGITLISIIGTIQLKKIKVNLLFIGLSSVTLAFVSHETLFLTLIPFLGATQFVFGTIANMFVQVNANIFYRGRVVAILTSLFIGGQAIGGPIIGFLVDHLGGESTFLITGSVTTIVALVALSMNKRRPNP